MCLNGGEDLCADDARRLAGVALEDDLEAGFLERLARRVLGLGDAVAVEHEQVARVSASRPAVYSECSNSPSAMPVPCSRSNRPSARG